MKAGVKFLMHPAGIWRLLALAIASVSLAAAASIVWKLVISKSRRVFSISSVKSCQFALL